MDANAEAALMAKWAEEAFAFLREQHAQERTLPSQLDEPYASMVAALET